jgi:hypothetical protein
VVITLEGCYADPVSFALARLLMGRKCDAGLEAEAMLGPVHAWLANMRAERLA